MSIGALRQTAIDLSGSSTAHTAGSVAHEVSDLTKQLANASSSQAQKIMALLSQKSSELNQIMDALKKIYEIDQKLSRTPQ